MSKQQPSRPAARRTGPPTQVAPTKTSRGPSPEELRNLPAFEDGGTAVDLDPQNASTGKMVDETATIASAKFITQDWKRKDGSYPDNAISEIQIAVSYRRDGDEEGGKAYQESYKYGNVSLFAPSKDGNRIFVRPSAIKAGSPAPRPRKTAPGVLFLQSIKDAGGKNIIDAVNKDGISALVGLRVHVRSRKVEGMHDNAGPVLLVDYIEGVSAPATSAPAPVQLSAAAPANKVGRPPKAAVPAVPAVPAVVAEVAVVDADIDALSEQALIDIIGESTTGSISRAQIPATIIKSANWTSHEKRPEIMKRLRDDEFYAKAGSPFSLDSANNVTLA